VRDGTATLRVTAPDGAARNVTARPDGTGGFSATVPAGSTAELVAVRDDCGNTTA